MSQFEIKRLSSKYVSDARLFNFRLISRGFVVPISHERPQVYIDRNQELLTPMIVPVLEPSPLEEPTPIRRASSARTGRWYDTVDTPKSADLHRRDPER